MNAPLIEYPFPLRPGLRVYLKLPADLTAKEADRIVEFLKTLLMPETKEDKHEGYNNTSLGEPGIGSYSHPKDEAFKKADYTTDCYACGRRNSCSRIMPSNPMYIEGSLDFTCSGCGSITRYKELKLPQTKE